MICWAAILAGATLLAATTAVVHAQALSAQTTTGTVCDVTKYGAASRGADAGPAIQQAFGACCKSGQCGGATILIPAGTYGLKTRVVLANFQDLTIVWDGDVTLGLGLPGDAWFQINRASNVVVTGKGTFSGQGRQYRQQNGNNEHNPRLIRCYGCDKFEIAGVTLHDAPSYHLVIHGANGYIHDLSITSGEAPLKGTTDGIDLVRCSSKRDVYNPLASLCSLQAYFSTPLDRRVTIAWWSEST